MSQKKEGSFYRYVLMATIFITLTLCTRLYAAYQAYTDLLIRGEKYIWVCQGNNLRTDETTGASTCDAQRDFIKNMILIQNAAEFTGSFLAGVALDMIGAKYTGLIGAILCVGSMSLLLLSSESTPWAAPLGAILGGWSINILAYPAMVLQKYFPHQAALCGAIMMSAQCLSNSVILLINSMWNMYPSWKFQGILRNYIMFLMIPSVVFYVWILPDKEPTETQQDEKEVQMTLREEAEGRRQRSLSVSETVVEFGANLGTLMEALLSPEFICLIIIDTVLYTCAIYYQTDCSVIASPKVSSFLGKWLALQAITGLLWGKVCDQVKSPCMMIIQLISVRSYITNFTHCWLISKYCLVYVFSMVGESFQYFTALLAIATFSFSYTIKFTYICETFPAHLHGTLLGLAGSLGILAIGCVQGLGKLRENQDSFMNCATLAIISCICLPIPLYLWVKSGKKLLGKED